MKNTAWVVEGNNCRNVFQIISFLLVFLSICRIEDTLACPDLVDSDRCLCYTFEDATFLDCQDTTLKDVKSALQIVSHIHTFSIYDLDSNEEELGPHFIPQNACIKHIHISRTSLKSVSEEAFAPLKKCLETLSIVSSKVKLIPHKAISGMLNLMSVELTSNTIEEVPNYSFYGLPLAKVSLKGNMVQHISENAFSGLEHTLKEVDLSENNLTTFPITPIAKLKTLRSLKLAWNEMSLCPTNEETELKSLEYLDLNSNNFELISEDCLKFSPSLTILSFHFNFIKNINYRAFYSLVNLKSIDLSYNRLKILNSNLFQSNKNLEFINLSHNHLHHINGLLCNMPSLTKNILNDDLIHLHELTVLYLGYNNIKYISATAYKNLNKVVQIDLEHNKLQTIPIELLNSVENHIKEISIKENIIICRCQKNNTWTWIQDHPKIIEPNSVNCFNNEYPNGKCNFPLIAQVSVDKHNDGSVSVSWFIRNRTSIKYLQIMYYNEESLEVYSKYITRNETSTTLPELQNNLNYIVCLLALLETPIYNDDVEDLEINITDLNFNHLTKINKSIAEAIITQSTTSECLAFDTFKKPLTIKTKNNKVYKISSILNRRLGLIVGCSLGVVVFFIMVSVLLYTKIKERKRIAKSEPAWAEMNDYHSIHSKEDIIQSSTTASTDNILLGMSKGRYSSVDKMK
ncbi:unnamed protein product [Leptosia nina]|uniref:Uncharacterized protein n=1 Tax=Leptosia nina TaxID=320188 RepID=A0AAV1JC26_9NEOP